VELRTLIIIIIIIIIIRSRKPRLRAQGIRRTGFATPLYPQKFALIWATSGDRSAGIVRSRTKATKLLVIIIIIITIIVIIIIL
jgi:hypothetical protein